MKSLNFKAKEGFSLIELLIYIAIFTATSSFLVSILVIFTRVHVRQNSVNEVNQQISFVNNIIQQKIRGSSLVDMDAGVSTSTLTLRMPLSTLGEDKTTIYLDSDENIIFIQEGGSSPVPLTDSNVVVQDFLVTKYENPGGRSIVQVYIVIDYNTENPGSKYKRTLYTAISRVSAATFDSHVLPNADNSLDLGNGGRKWRDGYFSGEIGISGGIGIGVAPVSGIGIVLNKNIVFNDDTVGVVLEAPGGGPCYRLGVTASGQITTSTATCQ